MRVLYFTRSYTPHDHRFLSALAQTEHEVAYLRLEQQGYPLEDRPLPPAVRQVQWAGVRKEATWSDGLRLLGDLKRVIKELQPDLIHAGPIQRSAFLTALAGFQPLVSMSWGYDLLQDASRNFLWRWATRYTLRRSAAMIADCHVVRQRAVTFGMPDERIVTFPWGVDLEHFTPRRTTARQSPIDDFRSGNKDSDQRLPGGSHSLAQPTILSTRSWELVYGVDLVAQAFVRVAQVRPDVRLVMLGQGSQAAALRQIFLNAGVVNRVYLPGQVSYADLPRYYRSADLYVSASHSDGSSISLLEALACGCPVILSDIPGNREWVTPGEQGWLFPDGDVDALTKAILSALEQPSRLAEMGRAARILAEQRADWRKNFPILLKTYQLAKWTWNKKR